MDMTASSAQRSKKRETYRSFHFIFWEVPVGDEEAVVRLVAVAVVVIFIFCLQIYTET